MSKKQKKPTGKLGRIKFEKGDVSNISFEAIRFPQQKEKNEAFIANRFVAHFVDQKYLAFRIHRIDQNEINNLDFTLRTSQGNKYLELMEIAPLEHIKGAYEEAPNYYNVYDFAQSVHEKIMKKSNSYRSVGKSNIILLIYPTDYKFVLSDTATALLQYWTLIKSHYFQYIFYFALFDDKTGMSHTIYPASRDYFVGFDENKYL